MDDKALKLVTVVPQGFWQELLEHFKSISQMLPLQILIFLANENFNFFMQI